MDEECRCLFEEIAMPDFVDAKKGKLRATDLQDSNLVIWYFNGKGQDKDRWQIPRSENQDRFRDLVNATGIARKMVDAALQKLRQADLTIKILEQHFGGPSPSDLTDISGVYNRIQKGLGRQLVICDSRGRRPDGKIARGYVKHHTETDTWGNIHLDFAVLTNVHEAIARTIVHEASHKFGDTKDLAYASESGRYPPKPQLAKENADSYAWAALSFFLGRCVIFNNYHDMVGSTEE
jgi:hypothetical protein